jgi:precorrin-6B methylase 2
MSPRDLIRKSFIPVTAVFAVAMLHAQTATPQKPKTTHQKPTATQEKPTTTPEKPTATQEKPFEPTVGQQGKDVVWVPTSQALVEKMLDLAKLTPKDFVIDLGSGDGRTVITAAKRGAHALGIEYDPKMVELSVKNAKQAGVSDKATFTKADLFETDFSKATVLTMFLLPSINMKLRPKILDLKPGTRVVSNTFTMEDWEPDETAHITEDCTNWCTALLWIVPAKVEGTWQSPNGTLTLTQEFQKVTGTMGSAAIADGKLRGDELSFTAGGAKYTGHVNGTSIQGTVSGGSNGSWTATRR